MAAALSFTARAGSPGSLTIEVDAVSLLVQQNAPPNLRAQVDRPVLVGDDKLIGIAWGQGWAVQVTQRLIALGGNSRLQLLLFECPSLDSTDMAWGASGTIDATTDPVTLQVTPFGTSVYGRAFAVGDYIIWINPAVVNGRYQYEIDEITALNQNTFTLARRGQGAPAGTAQFASVMAAQSGQFFQLLDPTLFALWDGTHQVFKFLWDGMIVSAVSATTAGLLQPVIQSLIPIPPAAAAPGLDLGSGGTPTTSTIAPPPSTGTGGTPLGPDGTPTGTPLPPSIPVVATLPDPAASTVGQRVTFQGNVYIFTAPPSGSGNGYWAFDTTGSPSIRDTFANLGLYPAANYALGTIFVATDLTVAYAVQSVAGAKVWIYYNGVYQAPIASIPTALLGIYDTGFTFRASDYLHSYIWSGTAWSRTTGGFNPGFTYSVIAVGYLPSGALWHLLDGTTQPISQNDGALVNTPLATVANTYIVQ